MKQSTKKYFTPASYTHRFKKTRRSLKVSRLKKKSLPVTAFKPLWEVNLQSERGHAEKQISPLAFGTLADKRINWMKDVPGDRVFPSVRMDKLKMSAYYDKGIDVKYPWELSRFLYGNELAARYAKSGHPAYYSRFRELVRDWIKGNPFLTGVNWICTMDVAIRAINWILAANVFSKEMAADPHFAQEFSMSLVQHGSYIQAFPEIYPGNHTTNHTTADYVGLLYVARALPEHPDTKRWEKMAVNGLNRCMDYQVYKDGGSFEASAGYHRLVTELFGLGALLCLNHAIPLPGSYYSRLHSMFVFLFSICDIHGNSPLFGDNDSGTLLQFDYVSNHDYSYMKAFYSSLFISERNTEHTTLAPSFLDLLPLEKNLQEGFPDAMGMMEPDNRLFKDSGLWSFRRGDLSGNILFMPIGQNGHGGHNHLDAGSFTLSFKGKSMVVDPGTYTYTRNVALRNQFRDYSYHNTVIPFGLNESGFKKERLFGLDPYCKIIDYRKEDDWNFELTYLLDIHPNPITRKFKIEDGAFTIQDQTQGPFHVKIHLAPEVEIQENGPGQVKTKFFSLKLDRESTCRVSPFEFATRYDFMEISKVLTITAESNASLTFEFSNE